MHHTKIYVIVFTCYWLVAAAIWGAAELLSSQHPADSPLVQKYTDSACFVLCLFCLRVCCGGSFGCLFLVCLSHKMQLQLIVCLCSHSVGLTIAFVVSAGLMGVVDVLTWLFADRRVILVHLCLFC